VRLELLNEGGGKTNCREELSGLGGQEVCLLESKGEGAPRWGDTEDVTSSEHHRQNVTNGGEIIEKEKVSHPFSGEELVGKGQGGVGIKN